MECFYEQQTVLTDLVVDLYQLKGLWVKVKDICIRTRIMMREIGYFNM